MHALTPFAFGYSTMFLPFLFVAVIWTLILKGFALWHAERCNQKWWFVALLIINTFGILEIVYLIWFRPKSPVKESAPIHTSSSV